jgi:glucose-6-phosphate 1-dehydrogenase
MPESSTTPFPANPLREGLAARATPEPCSMVIFGATGDLTHRKLIPALYNLAADGDLPPGLTVLGFARRDKDDALFRRELEEAAKKYSRQAINDDLWKSFGDAIFYHRSEFNDSDGYRRLKERLDQIDRERGTRGNRLFYLSAGPDQFEPILSHIREAGLNDTSNGGWARVIVEKPFGVDLRTAHQLNSVVSKAFSEDATFRIDHYLGKETAKISWSSGSLTPFSSTCGTSVISTISRSPRTNSSGLRTGQGITKDPAHCATWSRTICSNYSA